jgi:transcriptional regulator with XRE-family HTH domain
MQARIFAAVRELRGLKQKDLALQIGRSQSWISLLENGKIQANEFDVERIASALGVDRSALRREDRNLLHHSI